MKAPLVVLLIVAASNAAKASGLPPPILGLSGDGTRHGIEVIHGVPKDWTEVQTMRYHVDTVVQTRFAHTRVEAVIANHGSVAKNVTFPFAIPETAMLVGFEIEVDGEAYKALPALRSDIQVEWASSSATIKARDAVSFDVQIDLAARGSVLLRVQYEELLTRQLQVYKNVHQVWPGSIVPDLRLSVRIREATTIVSHDHTFNSETVSRLSTLPHANVSVSSNEVEVTLKPSAAEQHSLASQLGLTGALAGQWVVEYDVQRYPTAGDVVVRDGYFAHFFAPSDLKPLPKYALFLLDVSGSMRGQKILQLKQALNTILDEIGPDDYFTVIEFSDSNNMWALGQPSSQCNVLPASFIPMAKEKAAQMTQHGGTNLLAGLKTALECAAQGPKGLDPILLVLTDGQPSDGTPQLIVEEASMVNRRGGQGEPVASVFSLAFGDDADINFLRNLSANNGGSSRQIYVAEDAATQLQNFYQSIATPLLKNVTIEFNYQQAEKDTVTKSDFRTYFWGSELVVAGQLSEAARTSDSLNGTVTAIGVGGHVMSYPVQVTTSRAWVPEQLNGAANSERLWAFLMTSQKLDAFAIDSSDTAADNKSIDLALKYSFVTPKTCLAVDVTVPYQPTTGEYPPRPTPADLTTTGLPPRRTTSWSPRHTTDLPPPRPPRFTTDLPPRPPRFTTDLPPWPRYTTGLPPRPTGAPLPPGPPGPPSQGVVSVGSISIGTLNVEGPLIQFNFRR